MTGAKKDRTPKVNMYQVTLGVVANNDHVDLLVRGHSSAQVNRWLDENARTIQKLDVDKVYEIAKLGVQRYDATGAPQEVLDAVEEPDGMAGDETIFGEKTAHGRQQYREPQDPPHVPNHNPVG